MIKFKYQILYKSHTLQEADETHKLVMWTGKVKHRLKTAEGASTVELFSISALVPEKLIEQMPPTLFVSALAGETRVSFRKLHAS